MSISARSRYRLAGQGPDDWSSLLAGYLGSDLLTAGMPPGRFQASSSRRGSLLASKWKLLEPVWPAVKTTGYGQAARISIRRFYGVDDLSRQTVDRVQQGYEKTPSSRLLPAIPVRSRHDRVLSGQLDESAVHRVGPAHPPDAGHQPDPDVRGARPEGAQPADGRRRLGPGKLAPGHRLVVRPVRAAMRSP